MSTADIIAKLPLLSREELAQVQAKLLELVESTNSNAPPTSIAAHPALGIWKDRIDLPADSIDASNLLRKSMMWPSDVSADGK